MVCVIDGGGCILLFGLIDVYGYVMELGYYSIQVDFIGICLLDEVLV